MHFVAFLRFKTKHNTKKQQHGAGKYNKILSPMISDPERALYSVVDAPKDALFMVAVGQLFDSIASISPHNNKVYDSKLLFPSPEIKTSLTN